MTAVESTDAVTVSRAEWQRLVDRVAELEGVVRRLTGPAEPPRPEPFDPVNRNAPPHVVEAAETYFAELDDLLTHVAEHPADTWVAYRGRQRVGFGPARAVLLQRLEGEYPDGRFHVLFIDEVDKYPDSTVV